MIILMAAVTVWFQVTLINNSSSEVAELVRSNEIPCYRHWLKYLCFWEPVCPSEMCLSPGDTQPFQRFFQSSPLPSEQAWCWDIKLSFWLVKLYQKSLLISREGLDMAALTSLHGSPVQTQKSTCSKAALPFPCPPSYSHMPLSTFWRVFSLTFFLELHSLSQYSPTVQSWAKPFFSGFLRTVALILRSSLSSQNEGESYIRKV